MAKEKRRKAILLCFIEEEYICQKIMKNLDINITKQTLETSRPYRIVFTILFTLILLFISGHPESFLSKLILSTIFGFWATYGIDLIIYGNTKINAVTEGLKIEKIKLMDVNESAYLKKIPGIEIHSVSTIENNQYIYGACFKVSDNVYKLLAFISPTETTTKTFIGSDVLLDSFTGLKKSVIMTPQKELIISFLPVVNELELLDVFRTNYPPLDLKIKYPYIK